MACNKTKRCEEALQEVCVIGDIVTSILLSELAIVDLPTASAYLSNQHLKGRFELLGKTVPKGRGKGHYVYRVTSEFFSIHNNCRADNDSKKNYNGGAKGRSWECKELPVILI